MTALQRVIAAADLHSWAGLAAAGWLVALLVSLVAIRQAARAEGIGVRAAEAAHELRGPLCAARLALSSLERRFPDASPLLRATAAIDLELGRAGLALGALAHLGSSSSRRAGRALRPEVAPVDLTELARTAEPAWRAVADARATTLEVQTAVEPVLVSGDPRRLLQGMGNLIANACEHGRGPVRVTIDRDGRTARVAVRDEGEGPSVAVVRRARRRARAGWAPGTRASLRGHGMAIVARVARDGGGRLHAEADAAGAVVWLELPLDPPAQWRPRVGRERMTRLAGRSVGRASHESARPGLPAPLVGAR